MSERKHEKFVSSSISHTEMNEQIEKQETEEAEEKERQLDKEVAVEFKDIQNKLIEEDRVPLWEDLRKEMKEKGVGNTIDKTIHESLPESLEEILGGYERQVIDKIDKDNPEKTLKIVEKFCEKLKFYGEMATDRNKGLSHRNIVSVLENFSEALGKQGFEEEAERATSYVEEVNKYWDRKRK